MHRYCRVGNHSTVLKLGREEHRAGEIQSPARRSHFGGDEMKTLVLVLVSIVGLYAAPVSASFKCGFAPFPPTGCRYICMCDSFGNNCRWVVLC